MHLNRLLGFALALTSASSLTFAQTNYQLRVEIPFDFSVGGQSMAAGLYEVRQGHAPTIVRLSSVDFKHNMFILTSQEDSRVRAEAAYLQFNRYGDRYFLAKVQPRGVSTGRALRVSRQEREVAAGFAQRAHRQVLAKDTKRP